MHERKINGVPYKDYTTWTLNLTLTPTLTVTLRQKAKAYRPNIYIAPQVTTAAAAALFLSQTERAYSL